MFEQAINSVKSTLLFRERYDNFDTVLNGITVRGSIVGTRLDLQQALAFAGEGKVRATVSTDQLENINQVFDRMRRGEIEGRVVLDLAGDLSNGLTDRR